MTSALRGLVILLAEPPAPSETFLEAHLRLLPGPPRAVVGYPPVLDGRPVLSPIARLGLAAQRRLVPGRPRSWGVTRALVTALRAAGARAVLAEYGPVGVGALDACRDLGLPLAVHFHGFDASVTSVLETHREGYARLLREAAAIIGVSHPMCERLAAMGAPPDRLHRIPYGVDTERFHGANPAQAKPRLLAVGRLVAKKGVHHTLRAFARTLVRCPDASLRIVGDGPLRRELVDLTRQLGIDHATEFLGTLSPESVAAEMRAARAFVQHSVVAPNGDREGTPVAIIEAGATGLPVVSTRHEGIPEVVLDGVTGWLAEEGDELAMARGMIRLVEDPVTAARMGEAARHRIEAEYRQDRQIGRLTAVLETLFRPAPKRPEST